MGKTYNTPAIARAITIFKNAAVIPLHIPRIVREPDAPGWLLVYRSFGWAFGSRHEALAAWHDRAREVR
jgi:hypothetical protein